MRHGRTIVEEIRSSETFAKLDYRQRDLFQGLIEVADDQGRLPGTPTMVRSRVWPADDISIDEVQSDLNVLAGGEDPFIKIYKVDGKTYLQIINWWIYQPMQWAQESNYPAPEGWTDRWRYTGPGKKIISKNWEKVGGYSVELKAVPAPVPAGLPDEVPLPTYKDKDKEKHKNKEKDKEKENENLKPSAENSKPSGPSLEQLQESWNYAIGELRTQQGINRAFYETYVSGLKVTGKSGNSIQVKAVNQYTVDLITTRAVKTMLERSLRAILVNPEINIEFWVDAPPKPVPIEQDQVVESG
ncbi:MAG: hypothetical protein AB9897_01165 [Anaerolineaceae bacterium]